MNRRGFLGGILAACVAPYVMSNSIASGILMPVRKLWVPTETAVLNLLDWEGKILCSLQYPSSILNVPVAAPVMNTGIVKIAKLWHPELGPVIVKGLKFDSDCLVFGSTLHMSPLQIA